MQWGVTRSYIRVNRGRKGFKMDFYMVWHAKKFWRPKCFLRRIVAPRILRNWQRLRYGWNRVGTGGTGLIRLYFRMDPVRNPAVCDCSINYHPFGSLIFTRIKSGSYLWMSLMRYTQGSMRFYAAVEAGRCSSNRFNTDIDTELEYLQKNFEHDPKSFFTIW
jgi:hypothetical protein